MYEYIIDNSLCPRCQLLNSINKPLSSSFVVRTATSEKPIPSCDDWQDIMDNIPVVNEMIDRLYTGIADMPCTC